ncbi:MAG: 50S ribosomal protein L19 [Candidatus Vogelbacteria bacterium]|nr:50S ribosomal protein L19 [Candidatus Vogelbacteria bacterium]
MRAGDTVRVFLKIEEKGKTRLQPFEGIVLARKHGDEPGATFTVRKVASGVGTEKVLPLYSPVIDRIEVLRRAKVRRSKLYYIRHKATREMSKKMKQLRGFSAVNEADLRIPTTEHVGEEKSSVEN